MFKITVTGDTYKMKHTLKSNGFQWSPASKAWTKIVAEASLDQSLELIRPEIATIMIRIQKVDVHGNPLSPDILKFCLNDMERSGVSVLETFNKKISCSDISPIYQAPGPIESKDKEKKKLPGVDPGFF